MSRVRRRLWLLGAIVGAGLVASWLAVAALAHAAEPPAPTVTFVNEGGQASCTSVPTVSSLTVPSGTEVVVVNETGRPANLYVGGGSLMRVEKGRGVALTLGAGQHDVRLAPSCLKYADAPMLAVTVLSDGSSTGGSSSAGSSTGGSSTGGSSAGGSSGGGSSGDSAVTTPPATAPAPATPSRPGARRTPAGGAGTHYPASAASSDVPATSTFGTPSQGEVTTGSSAAPVRVISARPVALPDQDHPKGLRVLAAIAAICVLGVTAAIIRAIVRLSP